MSKNKIISSIIIFIICSIYFYKYNQYSGKYIGFKCGDNNENNIFILYYDNTFLFKSDNLVNNILGQWHVSEDENITFRAKQGKIKDIGSIAKYFKTLIYKLGHKERKGLKIFEDYCLDNKLL
ncbi:MAG TPA: hypothetical protein EYP87_06615 [Flavobacteriaceae bacterium]|nr:hypothetical protein [Flavobacteriaceae bacterium]